MTPFCFPFLLFFNQNVYYYYLMHVPGFPGGSVVKNLPASAGDTGSIPGSGRSPGEGNGSLLQYSHLGNLMDRSLAGYSPWGWKRVGYNLETKQQKMHVPALHVGVHVSFFFFFGGMAQHVGSSFPNQGLNLSPLHWKCRVLDTGLPWKFPWLVFFRFIGPQMGGTVRQNGLYPEPHLHLI